MTDSFRCNEVPASVAALPEQLQGQLAKILDEYLVAIEQGEPISPSTLYETYPTHAPYLREYLRGLDLFHNHVIESSENETLPLGRPNSGINGLRRIGDFEITREIARGGMGIVYEAQQASLGRRVALKVLPFSSADETQIARFKNEAQAAAQIRHQHIVPVYAIGEQDGIHYYAMQLIEGQSLTTMIAELQEGVAPPTWRAAATKGSAASTRTGWFDRHCDTSDSRSDGKSTMAAASTHDHVRAVARLGAQAAEALFAAHEYGIVHRDIKPSNLLVDDDGKLWVTDFGLARCRNATGLTQTGDVLGTMRYMSPEQALGRSALVDHRSDIYSLGVTLYELATLHHPAGKKTDWEILTNHHSPHKRLRVWNHHIPLDFETIIMKALSEQPADRYATARQFADDFNRFLEGKPILASPPKLTARAAKWARRHRGVVYTAIGILLFAFLGQSYNNWQLSKSNAEKQLALTDARENLQEANLVLARVSEIGDQLDAIPGADGVRYQLLKDSLDHYQRLARKVADDPTLTTDLAFAHSKLGTLSEKLGKKQESLEHHQAARELWREQQSKEPRNVECGRNLALTDNNIGMLLAELGRSQEALDTLKVVERMLHELWAFDPETKHVSLDLATTLNNVGQVLRQMGRQAEAAQKFRAAIELYERLAEKRESEAVLRGLSAGYNNLGSLIKKSRSADAIDAYEQAIAIQQRLVRNNSANRIFQVELALTYNNLGYVLAASEEWKPAEACYEDAVTIQEQLVKASPLAASYRRDLAVSYNNLGMMQSRGHALAVAEKSFNRAISMQRLLLSAQSTDPATLSNLGGVYNNLALLLEQQSRSDEAEIAYQKAIRLQKQALDLAPQTQAFSELLNNHVINYANFLRGQDKHGQAAEAMKESKEFLTRLTKR